MSRTSSTGDGGPTRWAALALLLGMPSLALTTGTLATYEASYRIDHRGMHVGEAQFKMRFDTALGHYVFESTTRARGIAKLLRRRPVLERSEFAVSDEQIVPLRYTFDDGSRKGKRSTQVIFDWGNGRASSSYKGITAEIEVQPGMLDRMTMQTAVMRDMARPGGPSDYVLVHRNTLKRDRYEEQGATNTDTVLGSVPTKVYLQTREGSSRQLKVWVAPSLKFIPVRMEQQRNSKTETVFTLSNLDLPD